MTRCALPSKIHLLYGGTSPEREISLQSGRAIGQTLSAAGYEVCFVDPAEQRLSEVLWEADSLAVIMLHGTYGEDGQVQAELDALGVRYTGSDARSSRLAFHKQDAKELFVKHSLPTPRWICLNGQTSPEEVAAMAAEIDYPLVVKPEAQGSSIGVSIVHSSANLWSAFECARQYDSLILIEQAIPGEEWTVPILDRAALPAIRVASTHTFFDYSAKYLDDETQYFVTAQGENPVSQAVTDVSLKACELLGTSGVCRVDLIVDPSGQPWILEVNTLPGMTDHSLVPKAAASLGWSPQELCNRILFSAFSNRSRE